MEFYTFKPTGQLCQALRWTDDSDHPHVDRLGPAKKAYTKNGHFLIPEGNWLVEFPPHGHDNPEIYAKDMVRNQVVVPHEFFMDNYQTATEEEIASWPEIQCRSDEPVEP
jgi:hypothetical protein